MKKRLLSMILALSMMLTIMPVNAITALADTTERVYQCGATAEDSVTATLQYHGVSYCILTISGNGKMQDYTEKTVPWASYADDIKEVVVSDGVTSIGDYAAYNCTYLQEITIADSVTSIGNYAFSKCGSGTFMQFPDIPNVTTLGEGVFSECSNMTSCPTFSNTITKIPDKIFYGCTGIKSYTIPSNITEIGKGAFQNCGIESITIPDNVQTIEAEAFQSCEKLKSVTFAGNSKITKIENCVFARCTALTTISIPTSVTAIGSEAFQVCTSLTNVVIPDGVTSIGDKGFYYCSALESVTIPSKPSKVELGLSAFENSGLKEVTIPENVTFNDGNGYHENTFTDCKKLKKAVINAKVENLGSVFRNCTTLDDVTLPNTLKSLNYTFYGCTALKEITLPEGLETIGTGAFYNSGLESIEIPATVKTIKGADTSYFYTAGWPAFAASKLKSVTMKDGTTPLTIEDYAFYKCKDLRTVKLPKRLSKIGANSFSECKNSSADCLTEVEYNGSDKDLTGVKFVKDYDKALRKSIDDGWILKGGSDWITILHNCILNFYKDDSSEDVLKTITVRRNQTIASVNETIPIPTKEGYTFDGWYLKENSTKKVEESILNGNIDESMDLVAHWTKATEHATVTVGTLNNSETLVKGNGYQFIVTVDPKEDTGSAKLTFGDVKGTIKDSNGTTVDATNGMDITLTTGDTQNLIFTFIPSEAGDNQTLTATLTKADNSTVGSTNYSVRERQNATVAISGLDASTTVKAGEAQNFTVSVEPNDDTIEKVTFGTTSGEVQWSSDNGNTWTTVTGEVDYSDLTGKQFRVVPAADAANGTATVTVTAKKADGTEVTKTASFTVTAREHATVKINDLNGKTIKQNKAHTFTVTVTASDDSGEATLTFDNVAGLTYKGNPVTNAGVTVTLTKDQPATLTFTLTPSETGSKTLKATLNNGANDIATYTVSEYVHATVAIEGLDDGDLKQGESTDFKVKVDPKDDRGTATIDFGDKNSEIQYKDGEDWKPLPDTGLEIDLSNGEKTYDFRITPKNDGNQTLTATVKQGDTKLGETTKDFTVIKKEEPVKPNPGGDGGNTNPGGDGGNTNPGGDGGNTNPGGDGGNTNPGGDGGNTNPGGDGGNTNPGGDGGNTNPGGDGGNTNPGGDGGNTNPGGDGGNTNPGGDGGNTNPGDGDHTGDKDPETKSYELTVIGGSFTAKQGENALTVETTKADNSLTAKIPEGAVVTVTLNKDAVPEGMVFDQWKINDDDLMGSPDVAYDQETFHFTMPEHDVKVEVMYRDATIESDGPGILGTGAMIATVGISAAALAYQGHMLGTEFALRCMLPEWALIPQNRAELAVLLWQDADSPEPVSTNLYSDISEDDSAVQKAARWAVENDLMELLDAEEAPENFDPFVPVTYLDSIHAWKKAQELKK